MSWELDARSAEDMLVSSRIPSSQQIINLIRRVNPTSLCLCDSDRERGYRLKDLLQNMLLENYGEAFRLAPHPFDPDIVLIKHVALPSVDACHAYLKTLSAKALDTVSQPASKAAERGPAKRVGKGCPCKETARASSPGTVLKTAERLLEEYDYAEAEELLAEIRISRIEELPTLVRAARMLSEEMGAYDRAIEILLSQPKHLMKNKEVRELLALAYHSNGMLPEARAIFGSVPPADLGKHALHAYADISFKDGNPSTAFHLLKTADEKEGFVTAFAGLKREIESCMLAEVEPLVERAEAALARDELAQAASLAQEALRCYPGFPRARHIVAVIESMKAEDEIGGLWESLERAEHCSEKLDLLARLLECDKGNKEKIKHMLAVEKTRRRKETVDGRLRILRTLAEQGNWPECFDILMWLSRQEEDPELQREGFSLSPLFSLLYRNKRIHRLGDESLKELWLSFVEVKSLLLSGRHEGCLERLEGMSPYFHSRPQFKDEYDKALKIELEGTRREIDDQLVQLMADPCTLEQARRIVAGMRKPLAALPAEEGARYWRAVEERLDRLKPAKTDEGMILEYRSALLVGNAAKAASLAEQITEKDSLRVIDAEIAEMFGIRAEPIIVTVSPDMDVDLASESPPLKRIGWTDRHALYREDEETLVVVNLWQMTATRFRSPNFKDLIPLDFMPAQDLVLFWDRRTVDTVWRAKLSPEKCRFVAVFDVSQRLRVEEGATVETVLMSSSKESDYYLHTYHEEAVRPARISRQSLDNKSSTEKVIKSKDKARSRMYRVSWERDSFMIRTDCGTRVYNRNLDIRADWSLDYKLYAIDVGKSHIYVTIGLMVAVLDAKLCLVKSYKNGISCGIYDDIGRVMGICPATSTVLLGIDKEEGKGTFYNMETNEFSNTFNFNRITCTQVPSTWYYFDYDKDRSAMSLRNITDEVADLLEWRVIYSAGSDNETNAANMVDFQENFPLRPRGSADASQG